MTDVSTTCAVVIFRVKEGYRTGCRNASHCHQQFFSELHSPRSHHPRQAFKLEVRIICRVTRLTFSTASLVHRSLLCLTCDLEISAVAESSTAPFNTNTPFPVKCITQHVTHSVFKFLLSEGNLVSSKIQP